MLLPYSSSEECLFDTEITLSKQYSQSTSTPSTWIPNQTSVFGLAKIKTKPKHNTHCFSQVTKIPDIPFQTQQLQW